MAEITYIKRAEQVVTMGGASAAPKTGAGMAEIGVIERGSVILEDDKIAFVGADREAVEYAAGAGGEVTVIDGTGKIAVPGLVDPHTHLVYAGSREREFELRLQGKKYIDILREGGGILSTTAATRAASLEELAEQSVSRLRRLLLHGVTTAEVKSGYGLTVADELKQLRAVSLLGAKQPVELVPTFMGAHAVPAEYKHDPEAYVALVTEEMIPRVAEERLAEYCDVFCEEGVFTPGQSERILEAGKRYGLKPKIHADEIAPLGGAELAAKVGAVSAEHLLQTSGRGIEALAESGTIAVLLPATALFLMERPARARAMIDAGVAVALATDCNPGSSPTQSLPFVMNAACLTMRMTPAEALTAATINAAHAIGRAQLVGSLEKGKQADVVLFDAPNYQTLQYHFAVNLVHTVIKKGKVVVKGGVVLEGA